MKKKILFFCLVFMTITIFPLLCLGGRKHEDIVLKYENYNKCVKGADILIALWKLPYHMVIRYCLNRYLG